VAAGLEDLGRASDAVGAVIARIDADQWDLPTPCTDWNVRQLVSHLVFGNRVFLARLSGAAMPDRTADHLGDDPAAAFRNTASDLQEALSRAGVLERSYPGPLGVITGAETLQIRLYDLLAHGWDLEQASGIPANLPADAAAESLVFVRRQLATAPRTGRFAEPQSCPENAPAIDRLVAFLGRRPRSEG
jgi:uncharacterized protein (TIGR03086 family)